MKSLPTQPLHTLMAAQFLTAFADNAILFTAIAMALQVGMASGWYIPALQSVFLIAPVLLAPWVGQLADAWPKPQVLLAGNLLKLLGTALILLGTDPLLAYALVGAGAAVYGPAKYGILPEMVGSNQLVKANALIEGSTIVAIVLGTLVGGKLADHSIDLALLLIIASFAASIGIALLLPRLPARGAEPQPLRHFIGRTRRFLQTGRARFSLLGAALFWGAAAVLRVALVGWAALVLGMNSSAQIGGLTLWLALGVVAGAALAPRLIPAQLLRRARMAAYLMGALILLLGLMQNSASAAITLSLIGISGGLFLVPLNATLQEIGHRAIGAGNAVAIQNFFENLAMLAGVGLYTWAAAQQANPAIALGLLGLTVMLATLVIAFHLPRVPEPLPEEV
ncbi:lysophospholipid transporter LplT [Magnetovirga frankeli]|uniref:lysophospholipid transporter LplT n=1 Tax=Magnetovirga frankeli TaxID=947516 RepID=UPI00129385CC|nr:lysophospholipid transporter LplT [gamma proteobacterium SS-5]